MAIDRLRVQTLDVKVHRLEGDATIPSIKEHAVFGGAELPLEDGRCHYLIRLEVGRDNPELKFTDGMMFVYGTNFGPRFDPNTHKPRARRTDSPIPFEALVAGARMPGERAFESQLRWSNTHGVSDWGVSLDSALAERVGGGKMIGHLYVAHQVALVDQDFDRVDYQATYMPVINDAIALMLERQA